MPTIDIDRPIILVAPMQAEPRTTPEQVQRFTARQSRLLVAAVSHEALPRLQRALVQGWHMRVSVN